MSGSDCCFLTCIQFAQKAGKVAWYSHLLKNFSQFVVIHTVKSFGIVRSRCFSGILLLFWWSNRCCNLIPGSSDFSKTSLNIWKFSVHVLLKPSLENFKHYFASMWDEYNCVIVWTFFGIAFLGLEWKLTFSSPVATTEFSKFVDILSVAISQHHLLGFEIAQLEKLISNNFVHSVVS